MGTLDWCGGLAKQAVLFKKRTEELLLSRLHEGAGNPAIMGLVEPARRDASVGFLNAWRE